MRKQLFGIVVTAALFCNAASATVLFQPWSAAETVLFTTQGAPGSGWTGNLLTLNFGPQPGYQTIDANSATTRLPNFMPANTIGMRFSVSSTLSGIHAHQATVDAEGTSIPLVPDEYVLERAHTMRSDQATTDWSLDLIRQQHAPRIVTIDLAEAHTPSTTVVDLLFLESLVDARALLIGFFADGADSGGHGMAGSITYSDVGWITCESDCPALEPSNPIPEPASLPLALFALLLINSVRPNQRLNRTAHSRRRRPWSAG